MITEALPATGVEEEEAAILARQLLIQQEKSNFRHMVADTGWFGLAIPSIGAFLSLYAIRMNATAMDLGLLASLPAVALLVGSFFAQWWGRRHDNPIRAVMAPAFIMRLRLVVLALIPLLPETWWIPALIATMTLFAVPASVSNITFQVMTRQIIGDESFTQLVSRRMMILNLSVAGSTLILGVWLNRVSFPINYQIMFLVSFIMMLLSQWHISRLKLTRPRPAASPAERRGEDQPWRDSRFLRLVPLLGVLYTAYFSVVSVIPLRLVEGLGANETFVSAYSVLELIGAATMATMASRLLRRYGSRNIFVVGMAVTALSAIILAGAPVLVLALPAALLSGGAWATIDISQFSTYNLRLQNASRPSYTTAYTQAIAIAIFIGPLIGSTLANSGVSLPAVLLIGAALRLGAGWLMGQFGEPAPAREAAVAEN